MASRTLALALVLMSTAPAVVAARQQAASDRQAPPSAVEFDALRQRAAQASREGRPNEAADLYTRAIALQPTWIEGYWHLGTIYYDTDRFRECRDAFARVVDAEPEHGAAWAFRGLCAFRLSEYSAALDDLTRAESLGLGDDPAFPAVVGYHLGLLLARSGQFERAFEVDAAFVRGGNTSPEIVAALGIAMLRLPLLPAEVPAEKRDIVALAGRAGVLSLGMNKQATEQAYRDLVARYGDVPEVHYLYGAYLARERPAEGLAEYRKELARDPDHVPTLVQIALELVKQSDFDGAAPYAEKAVSLAPDNFLARKARGQIALQNGNVGAAIADLETARTLEPSSPSVRYQLARAYQRAGRTEDAKREREDFSRLEALQQQRRGAPAPGEDAPQ